MPNLAIATSDSSSTPHAAPSELWRNGEFKLPNLSDQPTGEQVLAAIRQINQVGLSFGLSSKYTDAGGPIELWGIQNHTGYLDQQDSILSAGQVHILQIRAWEDLPDSAELPSIERFVQPSSSISERVQVYIDQYVNGGPSLEPVSGLTLTGVKKLVSWLCQYDDNIFATVTEEGILVLEAILGSDVRVFIELDHDGLVEATIVKSGTEIIGLGVTTIEDLTPERLVNIVGSL